MTDFNYSLKNIDISSATIINSAISVVFAIIISIILLILVGVSGNTEAIYSVLLIIPSIIFCTLILTVFNTFTATYLYNTLSKKLWPVKINLFENKEIKKVSTKESSILYTIISTILVIIYVLIGIVLLPLLFGLVYQVLMLSGNMMAAYMVYQIVMLFSDPVFIISFIILSAVVTIIGCFISVYSYNQLTGKIYGVMLKLTNEDGYVNVDSINPTNAALIIGVVALILGVIMGVINIITTHSVSGLIGSIIGSFIGVFIAVFISSCLYNFLAPKLGKIRFVLDEI